MNKLELRQLIKEEIEKALNQKYQIVFWDINHEETPVNQLFNSEKEAQDWVDSKEWEEEYYAYDDERGGDYIEHRNMYFNPEDKSNYFGYELKPIENISESQHIQSLEQQAKDFVSKYGKVKIKI